MDPKAFQAQIMALSNATALLQAAKATIIKADMFLTQIPASQEKAQQAGAALKHHLVTFARQELGAHVGTWVLQLIIISLIIFLIRENRKLVRSLKTASA